MFGFGNLRTLAAAAMLVTAAGAASAATCTIGGLTTSIACEGPITGNDKDSYPVNGININVNDLDNNSFDGLDSGMFGINTWTEAAKVNAPNFMDGLLTLTYGADNKSGTWSVSSWVGIGDAMLVVKAGTGFIGYLIDTTAGLSGTWTTLGLTNKGGNQPEISHLTLYTTPATVPVPAAGLLLLGALGGLAALRRRKVLAA